jgi:hypothetical protein
VGWVGMWVYRGIDMLPRWCMDMLICGHVDVSACWCVSVHWCGCIGMPRRMCGGIGSWACQLIGVLVCQHIGTSSSWCIAILVHCHLGASSSWCIVIWERICYDPPYYPEAGPDLPDISWDFGHTTTPDATDAAAFSLLDHLCSTWLSIPIVFLS